jgi:hypothetical protein
MVASDFQLHIIGTRAGFCVGDSHRRYSIWGLEVSDATFGPRWTFRIPQKFSSEKPPSQRHCAIGIYFVLSLLVRP